MTASDELPLLRTPPFDLCCLVVGSEDFRRDLASECRAAIALDDADPAALAAADFVAVERGAWNEAAADRIGRLPIISWEAAAPGAHRMTAPFVATARFHPYSPYDDYIEPIEKTAIGLWGGAEDDARLVAIDPAAADWTAALKRCAVLLVDAGGADDVGQVVLRAAASGVLPFLVGAADGTLPLACETFASIEAAVGRAAELLADPLRLRVLAHRAWRSTFRDHALAVQLAEACDALGLPHRFVRHPLVTVFVPTFRVHRLDDCIANYDAQAYPAKELVISLHGDLAELPRSGREDVRYVGVPEEETVGTVMNIALVAGRGEYAIKMDDDDFYGPDYVGDMMLATRAVDIALFGKPPWFLYLQDDDKTYLRRVAAGKENCVATTQQLVSDDFRISGATHSGRRDFLLQAGFCGLNRFAGDTALYERAAHFDGRVLSCDGFETVIFRSANLADHTWRQSGDKLRKQGVFVGDGVAQAIVNP